ncbi:hypothetical protein [Cryptosporangium arvum]|uniref:hypothetical protein n=1 Tax=Cryptosporangium arvum TaxID=80871 RepID=UPI0012EE75D6|nr:hypothetical protein [Cryptosporangium arvum]
MAGVAVAICLLVLLSLRGTRPGAPARMGAIVAGIVMLLALMVGLRAHDLTNPRSDDQQTPVALRPTTAQPFGGAVVSGDPQSGLNVRPPATVASATYPAGAYISDARFCDGRLDTVVRIDPTETAPEAGATPDTTEAVPVARNTPSGLMLGIRAGSDPAAQPALSVLYTPGDQQARLVGADGTTLGSLTSTSAEPSIRVDLRDSKAEVWFDGQLMTGEAVPVAGGCGAVRFSAWGGSAALRNLVIQPAN